MTHSGDKSPQINGNNNIVTYSDSNNDEQEFRKMTSEMRRRLELENAERMRERDVKPRL